MIPNLVCGYILVSQSVAYCLWVTVTLTSVLSSRKIVSCMSTSSILFEVEIPNILGLAGYHTLFSDHCDLDLELWPQFKKCLVLGGICHIVTHFLFYVLYPSPVFIFLQATCRITVIIPFFFL